MNRILILGTRTVVRPLIRYLLAHSDAELLVASFYPENANAIIDGHPKGMSVRLDITSPDDLEKLVSNVKLTISLLPSAFQVSVAKVCLKHKAHLITVSYASPDMYDLDQQAREAGVLFLNEMGLEPGLDHMVAMKIIHEAKARMGKIISFESCCGCLPVPEANDNPFGYKLWQDPKRLLLAGYNNARYLKDAKEISVPTKNLFKNPWLKNVKGLGNMEAYPNRDTVSYLEHYAIKGIKTFVRGLFRNPGWCETLDKIVMLGFFDDTVRNDLAGKTYREITAGLIGKPVDEKLQKNVMKFLNIRRNCLIIKRLEWLGLFASEVIRPDVRSLLDVLVTRMVEKMSYQIGEQDMIVLQHDVLVEYKNAAQEKVSSLLLHYGTPDGDSALSRTFGLTTAIAAKLLLQKKIDMTGVRIPIYPELYEPILAELEEYNIRFKESVTRI
jgi:saccharopine dehydrogenase (NADP+, L-glutamate forming)